LIRPVYEEERDGLLIVEYEEFDVKKPSYMILGLPDTGLVGVITTNHLAETLAMKEVGGIDFQLAVPPVAVVRGGALRTPLRLFHRDNLLVLTAEAPIPPQLVHPLASLIVDYALRRGVDYIVSVVGIASPTRMESEKPRVYWLASNEKARKAAEGLGLQVFSDGLIMGPYALILKHSVRKRAANVVLLAEAYVDFPDPEAAAQVTQVISRMVGVEVDVSKLLEQAEMIRLKMRELMRQTRQTIAEMQRVPSPVLYA
jgi:uncharacterized protein